MSNVSTATENPKLGEGIFFPRDVANILRLKYEKVYPLMNGFWQTRTFGNDRNKAVNFYALIEFYFYFHFRQNGMSSQKIKKFHQQLAKDLNTRYPFAHYEIRTDYKNIWAMESGNLVKADGKKQYDCFHLLDSFLHRIVYGDNKLASKYYPLENNANVVVDPKRQFGQTIIEGTSIKTKTIYSLYLGGETDQRISNLYNISIEKVRDAISFHATAA
jgi:Uncharacterized conserved protein